ncbi:hypothetical protein PIB30_030356 [Stylosanthes scabra]|uniref:Uncharacterized protein n=1 Tax=Stylosanthes scabra TaxID=79078 RepID=A0ABU6VCV8_9FABA|nr:hypothetical protein [Stylosanthes scabra]
MVVEMTQLEWVAVDWCLDARWREGNRVLALSLASRRHPSRFTEPFWNVFKNFGFESTPPSKFHKRPRIESIRLVTESIRLYLVFKFNILNALRIDSSSSESILKRMNMVSKGFQKLSDGD